MQEIECKFLEVDTKAMMKKLEAMGAKRVFEGDVNEIYYDFPDMRLAAKGYMLRLRKIGDKAEFAFKARVSKETVKIMDEIETEVDFSAMGQILDFLGLKAYDRLKKHRISFQLNSTHFEFDTFAGAPTFLEIEAHGIAKLEEHAKKLGLDMKDAKPWSGKELKEHYGLK